MTVAELIEFLKTQDQELLVVYRIHSEQCLMQVADIGVIEACEPRNDYWVHDKRPDKPFRKYLCVGG